MYCGRKHEVRIYEVPPSVMVDFDFAARSGWRVAKTKQTHVQGKGRFEDLRWRTEEVLLSLRKSLNKTRHSRKIFFKEDDFQMF